MSGKLLNVIYICRLFLRPNSKTSKNSKRQARCHTVSASIYPTPSFPLPALKLEKATSASTCYVYTKPGTIAVFLFSSPLTVSVDFVLD